jgi:signal transduction histidine kinase/HPt (histidine-containing phosphotransfer) domain-containing protein
MFHGRLSSIRIRLLLLVVLAITLAQSIGLSLSVWQEATRYAVSKRETLASTAEVLAAASARAAAERDINAAYQAIRAVGSMNGITFAALEGLDGSPIADVGATERLASDLLISDATAALSAMEVLSSRSVEISVPVIFEGNRVGTLRLIADTRDLPGRLWSSVAFTSVGAFIALILALAIALKMQGSITGPLRALTTVMSQVEHNHDYSISLPAGGKDEVGVLVGGFNAMIADIRERDNRLALHLEHLEREVASRTQDFRAAAAEAESANQAKSDFLATMSHEIRTPMNGILVMAELLATAELPQRARRQAEVIARSGQSLLAIINDILDISKIEAGKMDVECLEVDAADAVDTVMRLFADRAQSKGLDLCARIDLAPHACVQADPVRLGQVLANLVNNALKFTETGGVSVLVERSPSAPDRMVFSVMDTGIGIARDKLDSIFEAFSQADQTTTRQYGGTGLGLAIAVKLVTAMGGELKVESEIGAGTRFYFSLPAKADEELPDWPVMPSIAGEKPQVVLCLNGVQTRSTAAFYLNSAGFDIIETDPAVLADSTAKATLVVVSAGCLPSILRLNTIPLGAIVAVACPDEDTSASQNRGLIDATVQWPLLREEFTRIIAALIDGRSLKTSIEAQTSVGNIPAKGTFVDFRVLVADDSEVNREVAQAALTKLGIVPDLVTNGLQALDAVFAKSYDLVLMDGSMPVLDGFEATKQIRIREVAEGCVRTPVVALTAHVVGSVANAWQHAGMDGVLYKPFTLAQLADCLCGFAKPADTGRLADAVAGGDSGVASASLLDTSVLAELREMTTGSHAVVDRIIDLYTTQASACLNDLAEAMKSNDLDQFARSAHALKSMSYNVGAQGVANVASGFENAARLENRIVPSAELERLAIQMMHTMAELEQERIVA